MIKPHLSPLLLLILALASLSALSSVRAANPYVGSAEALSGFETITPEQMAELRGKKILFASRSFGLNMYNGLNLIKSQDADYDLISSYERYNVFNSGSDLGIIPADAFDKANFVHFMATYWPHTVRVDEVDTLMREDPWNFGEKVDVVMIFYHTALPEAYEYYVPKMEALQRDFPKVKFIYVASGYVGPSRTETNQQSFEFGNKLRSNQRGKVPLYDMAAILSKDNLDLKSYVPEYSTDPADVHPDTDAGEIAMAKGFLVMLKELYFAETGIAPPAPSDLNASAASESSVNLSWDAPSNSDVMISYYRILREGTLVTTTNSTNFTDTGLDDNTSYRYAVNAVSNGGVHSPFTALATAKTLPDNAPPTLVAVKDTNTTNQVQLEFSEALEPASAEETAHYTIEGITITSATATGNVVTLTTSPLRADVTYTVQVIGVKDNSAAKNRMGTRAESTFQYLPAIPTPVASWSFDATLDDGSGSNHAKWRHGEGNFSQGFIGQALSIDGGTESPHVMIPTADNQSGMTVLAFAFWAKKNTADVGGQVVKKHTVFDMVLGADKVEGYVTGEDKKSHSFSIYVPSIENTDWHHYALVYNGVTVKVFVDGVEVYSKEETRTLNTIGQPIYIGKLPWGSQETFNGLIDEFQLFDVVIQPSLMYQAAIDYVAVENLLVVNGVDRPVDGVCVTNDAGRVVELYLQEAGISKITADIGYLTELNLLHCYGDRKLGYKLLTSVDPAISHCTKLEELLLNQNDLSTLPVEIVNLTTLKSFSVGDNQLGGIGEPVRSWLNTYDPDWLATQKK